MNSYSPTICPICDHKLVYKAENVSSAPEFHFIKCTNVYGEPEQKRSHYGLVFNSNWSPYCIQIFIKGFEVYVDFANFPEGKTFIDSWEGVHREFIMSIKKIPPFLPHEFHLLPAWMSTWITFS